MIIISLKNQRILVAGVSRGIGKAIAILLSASGAEMIFRCKTIVIDAGELQEQ